MTEIDAHTGPYQFTQDDLTPERLRIGAAATLADFSAWQAAHPTDIAAHINAHTEALDAIQTQYAADQSSPRQLRSSSAQNSENKLFFFVPIILGLYLQMTKSIY